MSLNPPTSDPDPVPIADRIRSAREARGWSQQDLADQLHVTQRTVSNWERGRPIKTHVGVLENVLGVRLRGVAPRRPLEAYEDFELVAELTARLAERTRQVRELREQLRPADAHQNGGQP